MFKNLLTTFLRRSKKNKIDFLINLFGLTIAMLVFIFTSMYVKNETSFDNYHEHGDQIFRLTTSITSPNGQNTDMALANTAFGYVLKNECPGIEEVACVDIGDIGEIKYQGEKFENISIRTATPSFLNLFTYPVTEGKSDELLQLPNTIVLTESLAKKIFKNSSVLGKQVTIGNEDYLVNGIIEDLPTNTNLTFNALLPSDINGTEELTDWGDYFVYLQTRSSSGLLEDKIDALTREKYAELLQQMGGFSLRHRLQPLKDIHFDNTLLADIPKGDRTMVAVFSLVALLILLIAAINYTNITIVQIQKRKHEFEIRKTIGCNKKWIFSQVLTESVFTTIIAGILSVFLAELLLPYFNQLFNQQFELKSITRLLIPLLILFTGFGILYGLYPSFKSLKLKPDPRKGFSTLGKSLIISQNVVSIVMVAGVLLIDKQIRHMKNHDLGFDKEQLLSIQLGAPEKMPGKKVLHDEFLKLPEIQEIAFGGSGTNLGATDYWLKSILVTKDEEGNDIQFVANQPCIDENYIDLFGMKIIKGRNFSHLISSDMEQGVIVNEAYVNTMQWSDPIGKNVFEDTEHKVIGVVSNFNFDALNNPIEPLMFQMLDDYPAFLFIKTTPGSVDAIKKHWLKVTNGEPFKFSFIEERMNGLYIQNEREMHIFTWLSFIALVISCLGIYGLTSHFIINRRKEIGIRKVNGAQIWEILIFLNSNFVKWIIVAFVLATPIAWFVMNKWLENFAYKTNLSWWVFALAGVLALGIVLLTVSWQSWKAATRNPVEALRYE
ncbi:MAG: ABC transporter permease [Bacteroidales bacterium]|jgi:putative ABC transport system permease protein